MSRGNGNAPVAAPALRFILALGALLASSCDGSAGPAIVVSVSGVSAQAVELQLVAHLDRQIAAQPLHFPLPGNAEQSVATLGLRLPAAAAERPLTLAVAAFDARGCIIAAGSQLDDALRVQTGGNGEQLAQVALSTVEPDCHDTAVRLLRVTPQQLSTQGKDSAGQQQPIHLLGWGFTPDNEVRIGGQLINGLDVEWRSFAELYVKKLPVASRVGSAAVQVLDAQRNSARRQDLFSFFAAELDFDAARDVIGHPISSGVREAGDFDADGDLDLALIYNGYVIVLLGDGRGHFRQTGSDRDTMVISPYDLLAADLNGDGRFDLVANNAGRYNQDLCVLFATAQGRFQPCVITGESQRYNRVLVADFNGDERPDLAVANTKSVSVLYGNPFQAAPRFDSKTLYRSSAQNEIALADLDGNKWPDLVVYTRGTPQLHTFLGGLGSSQSFTPIDTDLALAAEPNRITVFDSGQGLELLLSQQDGITRLRSDGAGRFDATSKLAMPGERVLMAESARLNQDAYFDLWFLSSRSVSGYALNTLLNDRSGAFVSAADGLVNLKKVPILGRFDQDEILDLVFNDDDYRVRLALGRGDGSFRLAPAISAPSSCCLALGDVDLDGDLDVLVARQTGVEILRNDGHGRFAVPLDRLLDVGEVITKLATPDLDGDGRTDIAVASQRSLFLFLNRGEKGVVTSSHYELEHEITCWTFADLNGDAKLDIVAAGGGRISLLFGDGQGMLRGSAEHLGVDEPRSVAVGDLNGDRQPEVVLLNETTLTVLRSVKPGQYVADMPYLPLSDCLGMALADFDADGFLDAAIARGKGSYTFLDVMRGTASGRFQVARDVFIGDVPGPLQVADFNGDGRPDIVSSARGVSRILTSTGSGTFTLAAAVGEGGDAGSIAIGNLNGDALPDFVSLSQDNVHVVLNLSQ